MWSSVLKIMKVAMERRYFIDNVSWLHFHDESRVQER